MEPLFKFYPMEVICDDGGSIHYLVMAQTKQYAEGLVRKELAGVVEVVHLGLKSITLDDCRLWSRIGLPDWTWFIGAMVYINSLSARMSPLRLKPISTASTPLGYTSCFLG